MPKPAQKPKATDALDAIIEQIIAERSVDKRQPSMSEYIQELLSRAPVPLSSSDLQRGLVKLTGGRVFPGASISDTLRRLILGGSVEYVGREHRNSVTGSTVSVPVYRAPKV